MNKRVLALLMTLALLISCVPTGVVAEGTDADIVIDDAELTTQQSEVATGASKKPTKDTPPAEHSHSAQQHDCEHCDAANVEWTPWGDEPTETTTLPVTEGHYYLVANVSITAQQRVTGSNDVVLCLNGYSVNGTQAANIYRVQDTAKLTVTDCTSHKDADGNWVAGSVCNGKSTDVGGAFYAMTDAVLNVYNIKITGNQNAQKPANAGWSGGAIQARNNAVVTLKNVELSDNSTTADGGAICLRNSAQLILENCLFKDNKAATSGGAIYMATNTTKLTATGCTFESNESGTNGGAICTIAGATGITLTDCVFTENTAGNRGGALYADNSTITVSGGEMTGNQAVSGGAVHCYKGDTVLTGVSVTGNKASGVGGSAIYVNGGSAKLKLEGCTITGNQSLGSSTANRGGVYITNNSDKLTVAGATVIDDNVIGVVEGVSTKEVNVLLQNSGASMNVNGLTAGAKMSVLTYAGVVDTPNFLTAVNDPAAWEKTWVTYENNGLAVDYDGEKKEFFFTSTSTHIHCACGEHLYTDESCEHGTTPGCDHSEITYEPWGDDESEKGKLPNVPGNFYLVSDIVVSKETAVSTNSGIPDVINLCLNGHEIRVDYETEGKINDQIFYVTMTADLTISDCTAHTDAEGNYVAGKLTGGTYSVISASLTGSGENVALPNVKLTLFDGILAGNSSKGNGGAVNMTKGATTFNMYGGEISGNTANGHGGAVYVGEGNTFNMYGGKITGNHANKVTAADGKTSGGSGGGVYVDKGTFNMYGGEISDNEGQTSAGGVMLNGATTVMTMQGGKISGNSTDDSAGAIAIQNRAKLVLQDGEISGNTAGKNGGAVFVSTNSFMEMSGGKITGNSGVAGCGIYLYTNATLTMTGGEISGNAGTGNGGGIYVHAQAAGISLSGDTVITDNTNKGVANNLYLASEALVTVGTMGENAKVGITGAVSKLPRQVSANEATLDGLVSDDMHRPLERIDGKVYISFIKDHYHCDCGGSDIGCEHKQNYWVAWHDTASLPTGEGYYYLVNNVTLTGRVNQTTGDLHLCLNGHTVTVKAEEGSSQDRIWQLNGDAKLTISDCTAAYAKDGSYTAGKLTGGSNGVIFVPNNTNKNADGSEIANTVVLNLYDGIITGNFANGVGGALLLQDGATGNMYGGEISGNTAKAVMDAEGKAKDGNAAAVYVGTNAVFNLHGGAISGNTAEGIASVYVDSSTFNMNGGKIADNKSANSGAGVFVTGKTSVFTMTGGAISGNQSGKAAGGVLLQGRATMKMTGGEIVKNSASHGAGVYVSYTASFRMEGGAISNNKATASGGGLYLLGSTAKLAGGKISGNYAKSSGGGIYTTNFVRKATETRPEETLTAQLELAGVTVSGNTTDGNGAGIITNKGTVVTMTSGSVTGNKAAKAAGGILLQSKSKMNLKGGSISYNSAKNGGGIYVSTDTTINMTGGTVSYNTASGSCGGMYLLRCNATLAGGSITGNTAKVNGGGIYAAGGEITLCGINICDNVAEGNGGGIGTTQAKSGEARYYSTITMTGGRISGNSALNGGGVLTQNRTTFTLKDGVIENNKTTKSGAGMYISSNCTFHMEGGTIQNNEAQVNGGGIYHYKSNGTYTGGIIQNNKAAGNAGGLLGTGEGNTITIKGLTVTGNTAKAGGGAVFQGKVVSNIESGEFTNNTAESHGGAIYVSSNTFMNVTGGNFSNNTSSTRGGAFYLAVTSNSTIANATFTGNKAADGGAICAQSNLEISNCVISGNEAENNGGGIATAKLGSKRFFQPKGLVAENLTVENNKAGAQGGGLYLSVGCETNLRNSIVTGNTAGAEGGGIWAIFDSTFCDLTVTGNTSGGEGYGFYLAASEYDGESYVKGVIKFAGVMTVKDNKGGDMYIGEQTAAAVAKEGLSEGTLMNIKLHSGLLTQTLYGAYNYEGGNGEYVVTAGDKSLTTPEYDPDWNAQFNPAEPEMEPTEAPDTDDKIPVGISPIIWVVIGGAAVAIAAIAVIIAAVSKKKKIAKGK